MSKSKVVLVSLFILVAAAVASCGGGGGSGGGTASGASSSSGSSSSSVTVLSTTTQTVSSTTPQVSLPNIVTADFTGQKNIIGTSVNISQIVDGNLNGIATDQQVYFNSDLSDNRVIKIEVNSPPLADVPVMVNAPDAINSAANSRFATIFVYSLLGDYGTATDDADGIIPLAGESEDTNYTISATIPAYLFQETPTGSYAALIKIGIIGASPTASATTLRAKATIAGARLIRPSAAADIGPNGVPSLPCPVADPSLAPKPASDPNAPQSGQNSSTVDLRLPCIETSRFDPNRYIGGNHPHAHVGVDFHAVVSTPIFVPAGGKPIKVFTIAQYKEAIGTRCNPGDDPNFCKAINHGSGMELDLNYGTYVLQLWHLSAIDVSMLLGDGTKNINAVTTAGQAVAYTGDTGAGWGAPHLHYGVITPGPQTCAIYKGQKNCGQIPANIDPFPYIASNFSVAEASGNYILTTGSTYKYAVTASDLNGAQVLSSVGTAYENSGVPPPLGSKIFYDPTRKFCLVPDTAGILQFPSPDNINTYLGINGNICTPWGRQIAVEALASKPNVTINARYSNQAGQKIINDPLSEALASAVLIYNSPGWTADCLNLTHFIFTNPGQLCPLDFGGVYGVLDAVSSDPNIVTAQAFPGTGGNFSFLLTSGNTAGSATVDIYETDTTGRYFLETVYITSVFHPSS